MIVFEKLINTVINPIEAFQRNVVKRAFFDGISADHYNYKDENDLAVFDWLGLSSGLNQD